MADVITRSIAPTDLIGSLTARGEDQRRRPPPGEHARRRRHRLLAARDGKERIEPTAADADETSEKGGKLNVNV